MKLSLEQWFQRHGLTALIALLVLVSLGLIAYETQWGTSLRPLPVSVTAQAARTEDTSLLPAFGLPSMEAGFKEFVDRPLFSPTRRPVPVVAGTAQPMMKKGQFRLAGTIVNQDMPYAFLVEISSGKGMRVAKGAQIVASGISVTAVDAARVVLTQGEESEELTLRTASSPRPVATAPAPPMAGMPAAAQRPPPAGVVVGAIPVAPGGVAPVEAAPIGPRPGSSVMPGWVLGAPAAAPANPAPVNPADSAPNNQRRRRFPNQNVPPQ